MPNADTSQLEAVNSMLSLVGEDAVNSLTTNVSADVALAVRTLEEVNRQIQVRGWHWNTEREVTLTADSNSQYPWESDWIRVDTERYRYSNVDLVRRGSFLFNRYKQKNTTTLSETTLKVDITRYLDWVTIPEAARNAMYIKASRLFVNRVMGDDLRSGYAKLDEDEAMQLLIDTDNDQADYNFESLGTPAEVWRPGNGPMNLPTF